MGKRGFPGMTGLICVMLILALLVSMGLLLQPRIEQARARSGFAQQATPLKDVPAGEFFGTVLLGGFRAIAVDLIWVKAQEAEKNRDWHRYFLLSQLIASLQPRFIEVWIFNSWNMTYNLSLTASTDKEGWEWVKKGIAFGEEGFERNKELPESWKLAWNIGYYYYHKCGRVNDARGLEFQRWLREETGKSNWEHALEWFIKAYEVAERRPPGKEDQDGIGNPHWLDYISATYREMAYEAEAAIDTAPDDEHREAATKAMIEYRLQAVKWLNILEQSYRHNVRFVRFSEDEKKDLLGRLQAHADEREAAQLRRADDLQHEFNKLTKALDYWMKAYEGNPYQEEQGRHLLKISDRLEEMMKAGPASLQREAERRHIEIWALLISKATYQDFIIAKCRQLEREYTGRLKDAEDAGDSRAMIENIGNIMPFRRGLFAYKTGSAESRASLLDLVSHCENASRSADTPEAKAVAEDMARVLYDDLLRYGQLKGIKPGEEKLRNWAAGILARLGDAGGRENEQARRLALDVAFQFHRQGIMPEWAEKTIREAGRYFVGALTRAAKTGDLAAARYTYQRARDVWLAIRERYPDDNEVKDNLNKLSEIYKIMAP